MVCSQLSEFSAWVPKIGFEVTFMCYIPADPDEVWASPILASGSNHVGNDDRLFHIRCQDMSGPCFFLPYLKSRFIPSLPLQRAFLLSVLFIYWRTFVISVLATSW